MSDQTPLHRALGMTDGEYAAVCDILDRPPRDAELAMYSVMWSEHCSYKSSRPHLGRFPTEAPWVVVGPGENAGVIDLGDGWLAAFRIESHNHPSFVEPHQGAATGVGGILRDVFTMGARPIAVWDQIRFGSLNDAHNRYLLAGVVAGIAGYGNAVGVPTVGGEIAFEDCYAGNPLVNVMALGILRREQLVLAESGGAGTEAVLLGSATGRDGIGGASVLASASFDDAGTAKRPSVQVGDPFEEKKLIEACLELYERGLVVGIQDLGAAGLVLRHLRTGRQIGNGHGGRSGTSSCARAGHDAGRTPDVRIAGTHDGVRCARRRRRSPGRRRQMGNRRVSASGRSPPAACSGSSNEVSWSQKSRPRRCRRMPRSTTDLSGGRIGSMKCGREIGRLINRMWQPDC